MPGKRAFLAKLELFADLEPDELDALVSICEEYHFEAGAVIAYQRDVADTLYIVREGRLFAFEVDNRGIVRDSVSYLPGDDFGEIWLFTEGTHPATVRAVTDGRLIKIEGTRFRQLLQRYPSIAEGMALSEEAYDAAEKSLLVAPRREYATVSLLPDELVEYWSRRTPYLLLLSALPAGLVAAGFLALFLAMVVQNRNGSASWSLWAMVPVLLATLIFLVVMAFLFLDWYNDYFLITNKKIVHREFDLRTFQTRTHKVPLDQVQSVEIIRPNLLSNLLNVGSARITTAATVAVLLFDYIDDPELVKDGINRLRHDVEILDAARAQQSMRRTVEEHFNVLPAVTAFDEPDEDEEVWEFGEERPSLWSRIAGSLSARVEMGETIRYRKHVFVLLGKIWWLLLLMLGWFLVLGAVFWYRLFSVIVCGGMFLFALPISGWLIWRFEDWRNDTFLVSNLYVVDIDRQPFGFGESRKQAELRNVQNVSATRPNFLATLFNFGEVDIETAGADANIVFENVVHPDQIQSDIFQRRDKLRQQLRLREGEERRKEYAVLLDVYQQAREQNLIPPRTPGFDEEPEAEPDDELEL